MKKLLFFIAVAGMMSACGGKKEEVKAEMPKYDIVKLKPESRSIVYSFPAILASVNEVNLFPQVSGRIVARHYVNGAFVKKGQVLITIDNTPYRLRVQSDEANVKAAEATLSSAKLQYESQQKLFEKKIVSEYVMKTAQNTYLAAQAQLAQARAALSNSRTDLQHCTVVAPISGVVKQMMDDIGLLVGPSMPQAILSISDQTTIKARFSITEDAFSQMCRNLNVLGTKDGIRDSKGSLKNQFPRITLRTKDGYTYEKNGVLKTVDGIVDSQTGTVTCEVYYPNPNLHLHSGSSATIMFPDSITNAIVIPQTACKKLQDKYLVYKIDKNGQTVGTLVDVIPTNDGKEYIVSGKALQFGDEIIGSGVARIEEGQRVR